MGKAKREGLLALTPKQRKFVEAYLSNGGKKNKAAAMAGYAGPVANQRNVATKLMKDPNVRLAIAGGKKKEIGKIATQNDLKEFWTEIMQDDRAELKDRIKASELLGRTEAMFTDKHIVDGKMSYEALVLGSYTVNNGGPTVEAHPVVEMLPEPEPPKPHLKNPNKQVKVKKYSVTGKPVGEEKMRTAEVATPLYEIDDE